MDLKQKKMYQLSTQMMNLKRKVSLYKEILQNTVEYRKIWRENLKDEIMNSLRENANEVELECKIECKSELENLQAVVLSLGQVESGMFQKVNEKFKRHLVKYNGSLVYQQLFNGKVMVLINYPFIEDYAKPHPPKTIGIYRPEELTKPFYVRHLQEFVTEVTNWEDFDDDPPSNTSNPNRIGFDLNFGAPDGELAME